MTKLGLRSGVAFLTNMCKALGLIEGIVFFKGYDFFFFSSRSKRLGPVLGLQIVFRGKCISSFYYLISQLLLSDHDERRCQVFSGKKTLRSCYRSKQLCTHMGTLPSHVSQPSQSQCAGQQAQCIQVSLPSVTSIHSLSRVLTSSVHACPWPMHHAAERMQEEAPCYLFQWNCCSQGTPLRVSYMSS